MSGYDLTKSKESIQDFHTYRLKKNQKRMCKLICLILLNSDAPKSVFNLHMWERETGDVSHFLLPLCGPVPKGFPWSMKSHGETF